MTRARPSFQSTVGAEAVISPLSAGGGRDDRVGSKNHACLPNKAGGLANYFNKPDHARNMLALGEESHILYVTKSFVWVKRKLRTKREWSQSVETAR